MPIQLKRGQHVNLNKESDKLSILQVGLGWDSIDENYGILAKLFNKGELDCDASVIMLDENDRLIDRSHVVYYGNLVSPDGAIIHQGDKVDGKGDGDKERITIDLNRLSDKVKKIVFIVSLYGCENKKQHFGRLKKASIRIVDMKSMKEIINYNLSEEYYGNTALIVAELKLAGGSWRFSAIGDGTNDCSISRVVDRYR
ncbi:MULTISPECIES: TerD family protein [unclassified Fusibacter]|uniref:TerD family protein n=1 Tax=unclassified Fusibacter TaxID=2624464 RepID=UPI0013E92339|nr:MULTISPECIES: TerD family protein [unclassified Fusibacter]MCK8061275.1 TerD family protein [Fusibacter sp. A2]NPE23527.1 TerD family protein [Fusibacter sp. A1]